MKIRTLTFTTTMIIAMAVSLIPTPARASELPECFHCSNHTGAWKCNTLVQGSGGTICTEAPDGKSCTIAGSCKRSTAPKQVAVGHELVGEIGRLHAGVALAIAQLARGEVYSEQSSYWPDIERTSEDVQFFLTGGELEGQTPGRAIIHDIHLDILDESTAMLVITPNERSARRDYEECTLLLELDSDATGYLATTWFLR